VKVSHEGDFEFYVKQCDYEVCKTWSWDDVCLGKRKFG
jgi:hypothetical protein